MGFEEITHGRRNWRLKTYIDARGTRHSNAYMVLFAEPIDQGRTAPTYGDILAMIDAMLEVEDWNDRHLERPPQLSKLAEKVRRITARHHHEGSRG